jgi:hypothetical protein
MNQSKEKWWFENTIGNAIASVVSVRDRTFKTKRQQFTILGAVFGGIGVLVYLRKKFGKRPPKKQIKKEEDVVLEEGKSRIDANFFKVLLILIFLNIKKRLWRLLKVSVPSIWGIESVYIGGLIFVIIVQAMVNSKGNEVSGDLMFCMARRDLEGWWWNWAKLTSILSFNSLLTPLVTYFMVSI